MIYISFFSLSIIFLFFFEENTKYKLSYSACFFIISIPILFVYLLHAVQYNVGTDYLSYRYFYDDYTSLGQFYRKGELVFYFVYMKIVEYKLGSQGIFYFTSLFFALCLIIFLSAAKKLDLKVWILFFVYFTVTGIYHNQMNGLRIQMAISLFPIIFMMLCRRRYISSIFLLVLSILCHSSGILGVMLFVFKYI